MVNKYHTLIFSIKKGWDNYWCFGKVEIFSSKNLQVWKNSKKKNLYIK